MITIKKVACNIGFVNANEMFIDALCLIIQTDKFRYKNPLTETIILQYNDFKYVLSKRNKETGRESIQQLMYLQDKSKFDYLYIIINPPN